MVTREEVLETLNGMMTEENRKQIEEIIEKLGDKSDEELQAILTDKKVKSAKDVKKVAEKITKKETRTHSKFEELNEIVSFGSTGKTLHVHLIPKDARHMLTREGMKEAQIALIDAVEKLKVKMQTEKKYVKAENVYAVSPIMTGVVSRWFKELGFDVKTLPIDQAKEDKELGHFAGRFAGATKLGRANLTREQLMSMEWEERKDALREKLGVPTKSNEFIEKLQTMNNTDQELVHETEQIEAKEVMAKEVTQEVIE